MKPGRQKRNHLSKQKKFGNDQSTYLRGRVDVEEMGEAEDAGYISSCKNLVFICSRGNPWEYYM